MPPGRLRFAARTKGSWPLAANSFASPSVTSSTPAPLSGKNWCRAKSILTLRRPRRDPEGSRIGRPPRSNPCRLRAPIRGPSRPLYPRRVPLPAVRSDAPAQERSQAGGEPAASGGEVEPELGCGGVAGGDERGTPAGPLVDQEPPAEVGRGEEGVEEERGEGRHGGEAEEVEEEQALRIVAAQVVEGAALVGVDDGGARLVDERVAPGDGPRPPPQVLPEARAPEGDLLPHRAPQAGAHVVEEGDPATFNRRQRPVAFRSSCVLHPSLEARGGRIRDEHAGQRAAPRAGDLAPVEPGDQGVVLEGFDHGGQPAVVERHGVLHQQGHVLAPGEGEPAVAGGAVVEGGAGDGVHGGAAGAGQPGGAVRRARVEDNDLELPIYLLGEDALEGLGEAGAGVQGEEDDGGLRPAQSPARSRSA